MGHKIKGTKKFATVLQLEPLHTCNLTCTGCGRIREYSTSLKDVMPLEDCLGAADECGAPMVSICGGEPLIYPQIEELVDGLLQRKRIVYICTNALFMRRKMRDYLAHRWMRRSDKVEDLLAILLEQNLVTQKEADAIKQGPKDPKRPVIAPTKWLYWNVHLDGLERTHDLIVEREGVFKECVLAMRMAKILGYQVATNTTVYKETEMDELEIMYDFLSDMGVDGHTISPGYDYDAAKQDMIKRLKLKPENFFLTRDLTREKFSRIEKWCKDYNFFGTPIFFDFLAGKRDLRCSAWAIPTRNISGWKSPCYVMSDYINTPGHHATYSELLDQVKWENYGVVDNKARDPRCENCMMHCGYEPSAMLGIDAEPGDTWRNIKYNFGPRPKKSGRGSEVLAFNGVTSGNGHLTGKQTVEETAVEEKVG